MSDKRYTLGLVRIVLVGFLLVERVPGIGRGLRNTARLPAELLYGNPGLSLSPLPWPMSDGQIQALVVVTTLAGILALIGFKTRWALAVFTLGLFHAGAATSAYGWFNHVTSIYCGVLIVLVLVPGTDALSVDARRRHKSWRGPPPARVGLLILFAIMSAVYVGGGVAKLRKDPGPWLRGETLSYYFHGDARPREQYFVVKEGKPATYLYSASVTPLSRQLRKIPGAIPALAWFTLLVELGFVLVFFRRARLWVLLAAASFHLGIYLTMGIAFWSTALIDLALIGLPVWGKSPRSGRTHPPMPRPITD